LRIISIVQCKLLNISFISSIGEALVTEITYY
jgi:hypothetical protein